MPSTDFLAEARSYDLLVGTTLLVTYITLENAKEADPSIDRSTFEDEVTRTFKTFSYNKVLRNLNEYLSDTGTVQDPENDFLVALGFLHRKNSDTDFRAIITKWIIPEIRSLQAHAGSPRSESVPNPRDQSSPPPYSSTRIQSETVESQQPAREPQRSNSSNVEIWRYTSRLWEEAQLHDLPPKCTDTQLSNFPTRFRVIVEFRGAQGQGEASNKKQAKHIASRDVCWQLGIVL
ncbi:hypothetical protein BJY04DRAFT_211981 [Aspergillus karnatakaensis]|uniref:double-stranded RNA binding motif domain-containing protein n=1 Tax=Aspergillus karnatakaensis TaxID=1810916 RepID=UPI003CCDE9E2